MTDTKTDVNEHDKLIKQHNIWPDTGNTCFCYTTN